MKPYLLKKINMELNTTFNYYDTPEYLNQRSKVHQSEKVNINEFKFKASWMSAPELDEAQYSVNQVAPHLLLPPGEVWDPVPKSKQDFGDTGLLTRTTGDTTRWICPKCKYTNKPGTLMCEICGAEKPKAMGQKAEDLLHLTNGDNTTLLAASIPWSYPQEEGKKESLYDEEYAPEHEPNAEELLAIDDAQQLLLALDREHASDSDDSDDSSDGVFVALMAYESSVANPHYANRYIPVALGAGHVRKLCLFTVVLFGLAVVYDVVSTGVNALGPFPFVLVMVVGIFAVAGYVFRAQFRPTSTRV